MSLTGLLDAPSRWAVLDPLAARAEAVAQRFVPGGRVRAWLHGRPLGHPTHPILAQLPIGTSVSALLLDVASLVAPGRPSGHPSGGPARVLTAVTVASVVPTALAGWADYTGLRRDQQRTALVHASGNLVAATLWSVSLLAGRRAAWWRTAGTGVAGAAGALGGHLAYRWAAGPNHAEELPHLGREWQEVGAVADLPEGRLVERFVGEAPVVLLRRGLDVLALAGRGTGLGGPLHAGDVVEVDGRVCVRCPWDGSTFRFDDGAVVDGPASAPQPTVEITIADGRVHARVVGPPLPRA